MVSSNAEEIRRRMERRKEAVIRELSEAAKEIAATLHAEAKQEMQKNIYDIPIPLLASAQREVREVGAIHQARYRTGKQKGERMKPLSPAALARLKQRTTKGQYGQWERTGDLKRMESFRTEGPVVILYNNAEYARHRYTLGTPGHRQIRSPKVRSVQWQRAALRKRRAWILEVRRRAVLRALRLA